jgi:hypothetical protein
MAAQEVFWDLELPLYRSKLLFCGECAEDRPCEELHPIGKAGGQHFERATFDLSEFDTVSSGTGFFQSLEIGQRDDVDNFDDWWKREQLIKRRPGSLFEVVKNAPRISHAKFRAEIADRHPHMDPANAVKLVMEKLGYRRSTASPSHLALVRLDDDETGSELSCWNCGSKMAVGRAHLVRAVEHAFEFGGDIIVTRFRIQVRDSTLPFERTTHRRTKPASPPPVSFRRGSDFVAAGHIPE